MTQQVRTGASATSDNPITSALSGGFSGLMKLFSGNQEDPAAAQRRERAKALFQSITADSGRDPAATQEAFTRLQQLGQQEFDLSQKGADLTHRRNVGTIERLNELKEGNEDRELNRDLTLTNTAYGNQRSILGDVTNHEARLAGLQKGTMDGAGDRYLQAEQMRMDTIKELAKIGQPSGFERILGLALPFASALIG